jgi:hypothetical protein
LIKRTDNFLEIPLLDVQVDECGLDTGVAQKLLDGEKIGARL